MDSSSTLNHPYVLIGKITGVHGVRGMLKVLPYADDPLDLLPYSIWYFKTPRELAPFTLEKGQIYQEKGLLLKFQGIDTPEMGRTWVGTELYLERMALPALTEGHYWADLEGLEVYTIDGTYLGRVSHLFETGANDVLVVREGKHERLIPYVPGEIVKDVQLEAGKLIVEWDPTC